MSRSKSLRKRRGQSLVEYALLIAGVAMCSIVAISLFGEKTGDMIAAVATVLPGADADDNGPIGQGHLIETTGSSGPGSQIQLNVSQIANNAGKARLGANTAGTGTDGFGGLVNDAVSGN